MQRHHTCAALATFFQWGGADATGDGAADANFERQSGSDFTLARELGQRDFQSCGNGV